MDWLYGALIGVGGTIIGTVLGFFLNFFSNRGKIHLTKATMRFEKIHDYSKNNEYRNDSLNINFTIEFYNSSNKDLLIKDIRFLFLNDKSSFQKEPRFYLGRINEHFYNYNNTNIVVRARELKSFTGIIDLTTKEAHGFKKVVFNYANEKGIKKKLHFLDFISIEENKNLPPLQ